MPKNHLHPSIYLGLILLVVLASALALAGFFPQKEPAKASSDVIAIRVMVNPNHLSALDWYREKGFSGSPQVTAIDGYRAIRDGRTVYVNAGNVEGTTLYTNIYIISHNQAAQQATKDIFARIVENWTLSSNLNARGTCRRHGDTRCLSSRDCPAGDACDSEKARVIRDVRRLEDVYVMSKWLDEYREKTGRYPRLAAGSYLPHISLSVWPSWQSALSEETGRHFRPDPINRLGECPGAYDPATCWDEASQAFADPNPGNASFELPNNSLVYVYQGSPSGASGTVSFVLESIYNIHNPPPNIFRVCLDFDQDGYGRPGSPLCAHPETDCDDSNPLVHTGSPETGSACSDGLDNDCDGRIDCFDDDCYNEPRCLELVCDDVCNGICSSPRCPVDLDPDCACVSGNNCCGVNCSQADGDLDCPAPCTDFVCNGVCGENCRPDQDPDCGPPRENDCCQPGHAFPQDPDCDESCFDNDSDGYDGHDPALCPSGDDCNDDNPDINPGAAEVCDGIDNNCDGRIDGGFHADNCPYLCYPHIWTNNGLITGNTGDNCCGNEPHEARPYLPHENISHHSCPGGDCCRDGQDNDCDGDIDQYDSDCTNICSNTSERDFFVTGQADCDQCDLPGDQFGNQRSLLTGQTWSERHPSHLNYADTCDLMCNPLIGGGTTITADNFDGPNETRCNDGLDNDCDGLVDCDDPDCAASFFCSPGLPPDPPTMPGPPLGSIPPPPTISCQDQGYFCCSACQPHADQSAYDGTCPSSQVCCYAPAASAPLPAGPAPVNFIQNPGFESGGTGWNLDSGLSIDNDIARSGSRSLRMEHQGQTRNAWQRNISGIEPGREYIYSVWVRGDNVQPFDIAYAGDKPLGVIRWLDSSGYPIYPAITQRIDRFVWADYDTYPWRNKTIHMEAPPNAAAFSAGFRTWMMDAETRGVMSGISHWDDVSLTLKDLSHRGDFIREYQVSEAQRSGDGQLLIVETGYTGTNYFHLGRDGASLLWTVDGGSGGRRYLSFRYVIEGWVRDWTLIVNESTTSTTFRPTQTGQMNSWATFDQEVNLNPGDNTIRLRLQFYPSTAPFVPVLIDKLSLYHVAGAAGSDYDASCAAGGPSPGPGPGPGSTPTTATVWNRWEVNLTSSRTYTNPYSNVRVAVTYNGPGGRNISGYGFWDGGNNFKIRAMFPTAGTWTWQTTSSDTSNTGLHNQSGTVNVAAYSGSNPLYQRGYLKVSANRRYLVHDNNDETPFFWLADTPWAATMYSSESQWQSYIDKRRTQNFNAVQLHSRNGWQNYNNQRDPNNNSPFIGSGATLTWNPVYWQRVERLVQYANEQGFVVLFAAIRHPRPGVSTSLSDPFDETDQTIIRDFARNLAARMMGNFTVYSPCADDLHTVYSDWSAEEIEGSTSMHLVTAHPRFHLNRGANEPANIFHGQSYTDFAGMQTGLGWGHDPYFPHTVRPPFSADTAMRYAIQLSSELYNLGTKPVINLEGIYDWQSLQEADVRYWEPPYPAWGPRMSAYSSILSGSMGFGYGITGIWNWGVPLTWHGSSWNFNDALNQPSANHMSYLYSLFSSLRWWELVPAHNLILNQTTTNWISRMTLAKTPDNRQAVAYLPYNNSGININMSVFAGTMRARWFNPGTDDWQSEGNFANTGNHTFTKPSAWDDAILVLDIP